MLHVGAVDDIVPSEHRQRFDLYFAGQVGEHEQIEIVVRKLTADQAVKGHCYLLGGKETPPQNHRPTHINHQDGRALRRVLGPVNLKVFIAQINRTSRPATVDCVHESLAQIEMERIAKLVAFAFVRTLAAKATKLGLVPAKGITFQRREDVVERFLTDSSNRLCR